MRLIKLKGIGRIHGLHYTPDGRRLLAVGGAEVRMQDWAVWVDIAEMMETIRIPMYAGCAAVSADCTRIAVGNARVYLDRDTALDIPPVAVFDATDPNWDEDEWQTVVRNGENNVEVAGLAFNATGTRLAASYSVTDGRGRHVNAPFVLLPLGAGKAFIVPPGNADDDLDYSVFAFSPDGKRLAASGGLDGDPDVVVINARAADRLTDFAPPSAQTRHLAYSPDSRTLAVVNGKSVFLHAADSDVPRATLPHPKQANAVAFTPDGRRIISACHDGLVRIWNADSGQLVTSYNWGIGQTTAVAVSPDGLTAAAAGQKGQVAVFDLG